MPCHVKVLVRSSSQLLKKLPFHASERFKWGPLSAVTFFMSVKVEHAKFK